MKDKYDALKLENQLCFPLYACSKEIVRRYKPYLDEIDLTYTQYIAMMVLWEHGRINVKDMGALLYLDSGTLIPHPAQGACVDGAGMKRPRYENSRQYTKN